MPASLDARQVVIGSSDLPYTASTPYDTITFNSSRISTTGSGIYVTANNVTIDLQDDTLEFGTGNGDRVYGVYTSYHRTNLNIIGDPVNHGLILHGGGTVRADSVYNCRNVLTLGGLTRDITIQFVDMQINGWNTHNYSHADGTISNLTISDCRIINHGHGFTSRCSFDGAAIYLPANSTLGATITNCYVESYHAAVYLSGKAEIASCTLMVDAKNDLYYPGDPWDQVCYTSANAIAISTWILSPGTSFHDNVILSGVENEGCDGAFLICYAAGTEDNPISIYNNEAIIHRGRDDHYGAYLTAKGYKQRWSNKHVKIYNNQFTVVGHSNHPLYPNAYNATVEGMAMLFIDQFHGSEGQFCDSFVTVENNRILAIDSGGATASGYNICIRGENTGYNWQSAGNIWRNNYFEASDLGGKIGYPDGGKCINFLSQGDTLFALSQVFYAFDIGDWNGPCTANVIRDLVYSRGAPEDDLDWDINAAGSDISFERTLRVFARGTNDLGVAGAAVSVWNNYGNLVYSGFTNSSGLDTAYIKYDHEFYSIADSTSFNDFTVRVSKDGDDSTIVMTIDGLSSKSQLSPTLGLNMDGTGDTTVISDDTTPPSAPDSLKAEQGTLQGSVELDWLAPGDDGTIGTATGYQLMWSSQPLNVALWNDATTLWNPKPYGQQEEYTIASSPPIGELYVYLRAFDEVPNYSAVTSIVPFGSGDIADTGDDAFIVHYSPNPVHFTQGEYVTFTLPQQPVDLLIQTVSGETVVLMTGVSGEWRWNGTNASGNRVATGVYSWFVPGTDQNGKIVVKP
ncbi:MAG: hypothetical protein AB1483_00965 [Candidatus Zixiibacteriota bacterium]